MYKTVEKIMTPYLDKIEGLKEEKESWKRVATKNFNEAEDYKAIIKEVREKLEYLLTHDKVEINGTIYLKQEADDYITNYILEILDKESKE